MRCPERLFLSEVYLTASKRDIWDPERLFLSEVYLTASNGCLMTISRVGSARLQGFLFLSEVLPTRRQMADVEYFYAREDCHDVLYEVPRDLLRIFGRKFGMVDSRHPENMSQLLDTARPAKRHLNGIQPFRKVVWIKPWTRSIEVFEHHQPRAAPAPDFYDDFIRRLNARAQYGPQVLNFPLDSRS